MSQQTDLILTIIGVIGCSIFAIIIGIGVYISMNKFNRDRMKEISEYIELRDKYNKLKP